MATITLGKLTLPTELLLEIIPHVLPEGFESLALTCRTIHELCKPFIKRHNHLCSQFTKFNYKNAPRDLFLSPITTAFGLITCIAMEPSVALYIREADFTRDSYPILGRLPPLVPDSHRGGPVVSLFADSFHLGEADLDWKEYYALIQKDVQQIPRYSQNAAAFVLTLLPNIKTLTLPKSWKPLDQTEELLDVIVRETKQPHFLWDRPSLAQVTEFEYFSSLGTGHRSDLDAAVPFLTLPYLQSFRLNSVATSPVSIPCASKNLYLRYGETLETAHFLACCIDEVAIADFLKHTPRLRILEYYHFTSGDVAYPEWNMSKFVAAIEREAGSYLEELYISIRELHGSITPGRTSMRGFQRLQRLEFPLEIAICNIAAAETRVTTPNEVLTDQGLDRFESSINDLVPASVSQLSLMSSGRGHNKEALKVLFHDFAAKKDSQLPALEEIHLSCPRGRSADDAYSKLYAKLEAETEEAGVELYLKEWDYSMATTWSML